MLTVNEQDEKIIDKIISAITTYMQIEPMQTPPVSVCSFKRRFAEENPDTSCRIASPSLSLSAPFPALTLPAGEKWKSRLIAHINKDGKNALRYVD